MTSSENLIHLRLAGSRTGAGAIDFDALLSFGEHFRRALRAMVREQAGSQGVAAGRPTTVDERASGLRLVGISEGSAVLEFEPVTAELFSPVIDSLRALGNGLTDKRLPSSVHDALSQALRALGDDGDVVLTAPGLAPAHLNIAILQAVSSAAPPPAPSPLDHVDGWLHGVDLKPDEIRIREASGREWRCRFAPSAETVAVALLGSQVRATVDPSAPVVGATLHITDLQSLSPTTGPLLQRGRSVAEAIADALAASELDGPQPLEALRQDVDLEDPQELAFAEALRSFG